jgi:hypothetical protein
MTEQRKTAAAALYPNLPSGTPDVVQQRQQGTVADALYSHLRPPQPKPFERRLEAAAQRARANWAAANARMWGRR